MKRKKWMRKVIDLLDVLKIQDNKLNTNYDSMHRDIDKKIIKLEEKTGLREIKN